MNTEQLRYFIITAKYLNFSAAAKELYVTQPAISHQISALEKELGTQLFIRSTRKITLTKSGELFLEDAKRMLDMEETAKERIQLTDNSSELSLRIAYLLAPCQCFLPKLLNDFHRQYPQVTLQLTRMDAHNITDDMPTDHYDLYFSMTRDLSAQTKYAYKTLFSDTFCLICASSHPCANATKIDFNKIASEPFLLLDPSIGPFMAKQTMQLCRANNFKPRIIHNMSSMEEILFSVEAGLGITILPSKNKSFYPASLVYIPLEGSYAQMSIGVAWQHNTDNPAISWFLEMLGQTHDIHPEWF